MRLVLFDRRNQEPLNEFSHAGVPRLASESRMGAYCRAAAAASVLMAIVASAFFLAENDLLAQDYPPSQPAGPPPAPPTPEPSVTVLEKHEAQGILGKEVRSAADENMGRIVDILVDPIGQVRAAIIDFGGFLGVGSRKIAVAWNALRFPSSGGKGNRITLELTRDQVRAAPEYKDNKPVVVLGPSGSLESLPFP